MQDSVFTKIIKGELPSNKIYEDEETIAFLTIQPFVEGHTLVVPKKQVDQLWDLTSDEYRKLLDTAQKVALHLLKVSGKDRVGMMVKGFDVPHAHIHLVPINRSDNVNLDQTDPPITPNDQLAIIAEKYQIL